jgi:hypothetical protein
MLTRREMELIIRLLDIDDEQVARQRMCCDVLPSSLWVPHLAT